ncbi:hypothetical protein BGZ94_003649 [Podila epigama]|nr:hypothetical protein BGZ94_003649 [Podila epigama]
MLTRRIILAIAALVAVVSAEDPSPPPFIDSLSTCYNVCLHLVNYCSEYQHLELFEDPSEVEDEDDDSVQENQDEDKDDSKGDAKEEKDEL